MPDRGGVGVPEDSNRPVRPIRTVRLLGQLPRTKPGRFGHCFTLLSWSRHRGHEKSLKKIQRDLIAGGGGGGDEPPLAVGDQMSAELSLSAVRSGVRRGSQYLGGGERGPRRLVYLVAVLVAGSFSLFHSRAENHSAGGATPLLSHNQLIGRGNSAPPTARRSLSTDRGTRSGCPSAWPPHHLRQNALVCKPLPHRGVNVTVVEHCCHTVICASGAPRLTGENG